MSAGQFSIPFSQDRANAIYTDAMARMYGLVALGVVVTSIGIWVGDMIGAADLIFGFGFIGIIVAFAIMFGTLMLASSRVRAGSIGLGTALYLVFTGMEGLFISYIISVYSTTSIATAFVSTAALFGAMCLIGMTTKRDLSKLGPILFIGLFAAIIISMVNMLLLQSSGLYVLINIALIPIFLGLTIWETKQMKDIAQQAAMSGDEKAATQAAVIGSIGLYLNALNLFLIILRLFGGSRD